VWRRTPSAEEEEEEEVGGGAPSKRGVPMQPQREKVQPAEPPPVPVRRSREDRGRLRGSSSSRPERTACLIPR